MKINDAIQSKFTSETQKAVVNILYTASWINQIQAQFFKSHKITGAQYNVLRILKGHHPKPISVAEIINRMIDKSSNASRIIDRLEKKGWATRTICKQDRRQVDVTITTLGLDLLNHISPDIASLENKMDNLSETELTQLNSYLDKFRNQ